MCCSHVHMCVLCPPVKLFIFWLFPVRMVNHLQLLCDFIRDTWVLEESLRPLYRNKQMSEDQERRQILGTPDKELRDKKIYWSEEMEMSLDNWSIHENFPVVAIFITLSRQSVKKNDKRVQVFGCCTGHLAVTDSIAGLSSTRWKFLVNIIIAYSSYENNII